MKVLVIVNAHFGYDGISNVALNYYLYQDHDKVKMDFVTINEPLEILKTELERNGDNYYVLEGRNKNVLGYIKRLKNIIKKNKYDIVYVHGNSATMFVELLAAKLAGAKCRIAHSHNTKCDHYIINKMLMPLFSSLYTGCCACSKEAGEFLFGNKKCYVVNNGINVDKYKYNPEVRWALREKYNISDKFVVGHIGRFTHQKNHEFILECFKEVYRRCPDAVLLLVGNGELEEEIKKKARAELPAEAVLFYGTTDKVNEVVQMMDVFLFPSKFEGLGIVAVEAQASGMPCVISDVVPNKVKILDEVEFLSLDEKTDVWAQCILNRRNYDTERSSKAGKALEKVIDSGFDINSGCREMYEYYKTVLGEK